MMPRWHVLHGSWFLWQGPCRERLRRSSQPVRQGSPQVPIGHRLLGSPRLLDLLCRDCSHGLQQLAPVQLPLS